MHSFTFVYKVETNTPIYAMLTVLIAQFKAHTRKTLERQAVRLFVLERTTGTIEPRH